MAEENDIPLRITVDGAAAGQTLGDVRQSVKDLTKELNNSVEGSKKFNDTLIKLGGAKATLMDLKQNIKALDPQETAAAFTKLGTGIASGFQLATGAAALFGVENKDIEKTLLKVQSATALAQGLQGIQGLGKSFQQLGLVLKANPLLLIATIIIGVGTALFALKDKVKIIGDAFDFLGNIVGKVVGFFKDFTDSMGITSFAADKLSTKILDNAIKEEAAIKIKYEREIALAQAAGKETFLLEQQKHDAIIANAKLQLSELDILKTRHGKLAPEEQERQTALLKIVSDASFEKQVLDVKEVKSNEEKNEKIKQNAQKLADEKKKIKEKEFQDNLDSIIKKQSADEEAEANVIALFAGEAEKKIVIDNKLTAIQIENDNRKIKSNEEQAAKDEALAKQVSDTKKKLLQDGFNAAKNLSDTLFANALQGAKSGSAQERKIKKQQFGLNKGVAAVETAISTVQAVMKSLAAIPPPAGIPLAVGIGLIGAVNVAAILAKKFPEGEAVAAEAPQAPSGLGGGGAGGAGGTPSAPTFQPTVTGTQTNAAGDFTGFQGQQPIRAYVVETEISSNQQRVNQLQERASF